MARGGLAASSRRTRGEREEAKRDKKGDECRKNSSFTRVISRSARCISVFFIIRGPDAESLLVYFIPNEPERSVSPILPSLFFLYRFRRATRGES